MKKLTIATLFVLTATVSFANNDKKLKKDVTTNAEAVSNVFSGIVTDNNGEPIVGAELVIDNKSVYTDINGKYSVESFSKNPEVTVKYISFQSIKVSLVAQENTIRLIEE